MKQLLSPKQVALSIGVSESSLKRWCDQGIIPTERTPGGHRRLRLGDVMNFLRHADYALQHPELLGLPPGVGIGERTTPRTREALVESLQDGDTENGRQIILNAYLSGVPIVTLCDELLAPVMHAIGRQWECGEIEIYQEHRACEVIGRALYDLRQLLPTPKPDAPVALGGTPHGDHYRLATAMAELVLSECGWRATSLGCSLPLYTLAAAVERHRPSVLWLSVSHVDVPQDFARELRQFAASLPASTHLAVGGRLLAVLGDQLGTAVRRFESFSALRDFTAEMSPPTVASLDRSREAIEA